MIVVIVVCMVIVASVVRVVKEVIVVIVAYVVIVVSMASVVVATWCLLCNFQYTQFQQIFLWCWDVRIVCTLDCNLLPSIRN